MMMICWTGDATTDDPPTGVKVHIVHSFPVYVSCTVVDNAFICHSGNIVIPLANEWIPLSFAVVCLVERHTGTKKKKRKSPPRVSRIKPSVSWHISSSSLSWWMVAVSAVNPICAVWSSEEQFLLYRNLLLFAILTFHKLPLQWLVPVSRHSVGVAINYISSVTQCDDTIHIGAGTGSQKYRNLSLYKANRGE